MLTIGPSILHCIITILQVQKHVVSTLQNQHWQHTHALIIDDISKLVELGFSTIIKQCSTSFRNIIYSIEREANLNLTKLLTQSHLLLLICSTRLTTLFYAKSRKIQNTRRCLLLKCLRGKSHCFMKRQTSKLATNN